MSDIEAKKRLISRLMENVDDETVIRDLFSIYKREGKLTEANFAIIKKAEDALAYYQKKYENTNLTYRIIYPSIIIIEDLTAPKYKCACINLDYEKGVLSKQRLNRIELRKREDILIHHPAYPQESLYSLPVPEIHLSSIDNLQLDRFSPIMKELVLSKCKIDFESLLRREITDTFKLKIDNPVDLQFGPVVDFLLKTRDQLIEIDIIDLPVSTDLSPLENLLPIFVETMPRFHLEISLAKGPLKKSELLRQFVERINNQILPTSEKRAEYNNIFNPRFGGRAIRLYTFA